MIKIKNYPIVFAVFTILFCMLACSKGLANQPAAAIEQLLPQAQSENTHLPSPALARHVTESSPGAQNLDGYTLTDLYKTVNPGVVAIWVITTQGIGQGTGFVIDMDGHIVTNYHVVEEATDVEVNFPSDFKTNGKVIAKDLDSDLGIVQVKVPPDILFPLVLGDSEQVEIGQTVVAIGNPFGFSGTMTVGIISGKGRSLDSLRASPDGDYFTSSDLLQTDAAINPGNSGGPLINLRGEVVGVNRAIQTTTFSSTGSPLNSGVGFAISANIIKRVLPSLIAEGKYDYPYLGLEGLPELTLAAQKELNLPQTNGIYVTRVADKGPSQKAGLQRGDLIIAIDGIPVHTFGDMISYLLLNKSPKDSISITVIRGKNQQDFTVVLDTRP